MLSEHSTSRANWKIGRRIPPFALFSAEFLVLVIETARGPEKKVQEPAPIRRHLYQNWSFVGVKRRRVKESEEIKRGEIGRRGVLRAEPRQRPGYVLTRPLTRLGSAKN